MGCLSILGVLMIVGFVSSLFGSGGVSTSVRGDTAIVKVEVTLNGDQLYTVAHNLCRGVYRAARTNKDVKKVVGVVWMRGREFDGYGKPVDLDEELGRLVREADEVRNYVSEDAYRNSQMNFFEAEILMIARANGRGLFSDWK